MNASEAMRHMIAASGKSGRQVSREIGRSDTFISASLAQGTCPRVDTLAKIAHACGYRIVAVPLSEGWDPNEDAESGVITIEYDGR